MGKDGPSTVVFPFSAPSSFRSHSRCRIIDKTCEKHPKKGKKPEKSPKMIKNGKKWPEKSEKTVI